MKLHKDKDAFGLLLENIHDKTGYRTDVLEKDYYVLLILQELSNFQADGLQAYFKGGTALYKALKTTNRFPKILTFPLILEDAAGHRTINVWNVQPRSMFPFRGMRHKEKQTVLR